MVVSAHLTKQKRIVRRFKENIPGDDWATSFMKRWNLTNRIATNIRKKRAEMSKEEVEKYFANIETELQGVFPQNVWNYDETNVRDDPGSKKAVMKRGTKYPERVMDSSKVCYSLMFCGNAERTILPPYTVYKSVHLYDSWVKGGPEGARYNRTKSGWFDEATFEDWFFTLVLAKLHKQEGKKILIGDNLSSHLSTEVIKACNNHNIPFICLLPNATHLQPLDVAFYGPLKKVWRSLLFEWRKTSTGRKYSTLPKERFASLLKQLIEKLIVEGNGISNLINGFRKCGIYPFNPDEVYKKLPSENVMSPKKALDQSLVDSLAELRRGDENEKPKNLKRTRLDVEPGKSISGEPSKPISGESSAESSEESAEDLESESETDTESTSEAETQSESNNSGELKKLHHTLLNVQKSMDDDKKGFFYAVYYGQKYYCGKVRKCFANDSMDDVNTVEFSFLRYRGDDMWDFPKQLDIEMVEIK